VKNNFYIYTPAL